MSSIVHWFSPWALPISGTGLLVLLLQSDSIRRPVQTRLRRPGAWIEPALFTLLAGLVAAALLRAWAARSLASLVLALLAPQLSVAAGTLAGSPGARIIATVLLVGLAADVVRTGRGKGLVDEANATVVHHLPGVKDANPGRSHRPRRPFPRRVAA